MAMIFKGPVPCSVDGRPYPLGWCSMCAASAKASAIEALGGAADGTVVIQLRQDDLAVSHGLTMLPAPPQSGAAAMVIALPLCWSHLQAIKLLDTALAIGSPMPGGAVDLSARMHGG
jgi:hypothetical protein